MERNYLLMTLSAAAIAEYCLGIKARGGQDGRYSVAVSRGGGSARFGFYQELVLSEDIHSGCPFFYQAQRLVKTLYGIKDAPDVEVSEILLRSVLFLDCGEIPFSAEDNDGGRETGGIGEHKRDLLKVFRGIIENGIYFKFDGSAEPVLFMPSDRSASMARGGKISLVRANKTEDGASLYDALEESLMLGMDLSGIQISLSKYYAYRGLYLSDSTRLDTAFERAENGKLLLNEETVIVISDDISAEKFTRVITSSPQTAGGDVWTFPAETVLDKKDKRAMQNRFDGEGLICPDYSALVNRQLLLKRYDGEETRTPGHISSFQIRLPMGKGMLHEADYHAALLDMLAYSAYNKEMCGLTAQQRENILRKYRELELKDYFGRTRNISKAKIVLTSSMFKAAKWLNEFCKQKSIDDPMRYYFDNMRRYEHSLYIANDSSMLRGGDTVRLNYQFLNTLALSNEDLNVLFARETCEADERSYDAEGSQNAGGTDVSDTEYDSGEQYLLHLSGKFRRIVDADRRYAGEKTVSRMIRRSRTGLLREKLLGRIPVAGVCRFLSRDLLSLIVYLAKLINANNKKEIVFKTKELKSWCLPRDTVYMPSYIPPENDADTGPYIAMLRSPHLSRNEQCLVRLPGGDKEEEYVRRYDKYFSELDGVVMVSYGSQCPMALAGADFDGDLVKVISDRVVVEAVKKGIKAEIKEDGRIYRQLPVILIPSLKQENKTVGRSIDFEVLRGSFSSRIGIISNYAISLGKLEYAPDGDERSDGVCAMATILAGLEIDSVKTGRKPDLSRFFDILKERRSEKQSFGRQSRKDTYLSKADRLSGIPGSFRCVFERGNTGNGGEYISMTAYGQGTSIRHTEEKYSDVTAVIDKLPWLYLDGMCVITGDLSAEEAADGAVGIRDLTDCTVPEGVSVQSDRELSTSFGQIVRGYCRVLCDASREYNNERALWRAQYTPRIITVLRQQYGSVYVPFNNTWPENGSVYDKAAEAFAFVNKCLPDNKGAERCLDKMIAKRWQYTQRDKRAETLASLLGAEPGEISDDIIKLLCRFDHSGYRVLYYMVKNIYLSPDGVSVNGTVSKDKKGRSATDDPYLKKYREVRREAKERRQSKAVWGRELRRVCREDILELTRKYCVKAKKTKNGTKTAKLDKKAAMDTGLWLYASIPQSADPEETFLWDIFSVSEILRRTVPEKSLDSKERKQ